jgi:putative nucleotidyltransferase with HDIG domain
LRTLPTLSLVATYLLQQVSQENISFRKVSDVIRTDAPLSADMLRVANSALFGPRFPVTGVLHALAMLGLDRVRSLVTTVALKSLIGQAGGTPALVRCWRHNLACAFVAEEAARKADLDRDFAYTAGLLHDVGRLTMMSAWRPRYGALLDSAQPDPVALLAAERQEFGIPHTRAGFALTQDWKLPLIFGEIADRHHDPPPEGVVDVMAVVCFSCRFADALGFGVVGGPVTGEEPDPPSPLRRLIEGSLKDAALRVAERINTFECCLGT